MTKEEFYNQVAAWSIHRRQLDELNKNLTEAMFGIQRAKDQNIDLTQEQLDKVNALKVERKRLEFIVSGIIDTLDTEVDRIEKMVLESPEMAQKLNRK